MSYVSETIREKFESLPINLKDAILQKDVQLNNMGDLIKVLEEMVAEG